MNICQIWQLLIVSVLSSWYFFMKNLPIVSAVEMIRLDMVLNKMPSHIRSQKVGFDDSAMKAWFASLA
jgi:hypothetical protein